MTPDVERSSTKGRMVHVPGDAVLDRGRVLGRRERDDRHPERHRLDDGEPEARPPDRVEEEPVAGREGGKGLVRDLPEAAELLRRLADEVERNLRAHALEHVEAEAPPAPLEVVHDHEPALELAGVAHPVRRRHPVLDHHCRRGAAVPHERIERRAVHDEIRLPRRRMARVGRALTRRSCSR
jgi:hypothetical protein